MTVDKGFELEQQRQLYYLEGSYAIMRYETKTFERRLCLDQCIVHKIQAMLALRDSPPERDPMTRLVILTGIFLHVDSES